MLRLQERRRRLGLDAEVRIDHLAFPLEIVNERPTPFDTLQAEIPVAGALAPGLQWRPWDGSPSEWPVTTLPALEAVHAAKEQGLEASEHLDLALRRALFANSKCISLRHVILDVARSCGRIDADALGDALDDGRARRAMLDGYRQAAPRVKGSPHLFFPDGSDIHNPGIELHWDNARPVIDADDPEVYDEILRRAA